VFSLPHGEKVKTWGKYLADFTRWLGELRESSPGAVKTQKTPKRDTAEKRLQVLMNTAMTFKQSLVPVQGQLANTAAAVASLDTLAPEGMTAALYKDVLELVKQREQREAEKAK
jgi:hypothetical protein